MSPPPRPRQPLFVSNHANESTISARPRLEHSGTSLTTRLALYVIVKPSQVPNSISSRNIPWLPPRPDAPAPRIRTRNDIGNLAEARKCARE